MNWGNRILLVYIFFVAGIMLLVYKSSIQKTDLVTPDYYTKELAFQSTIEEQKRAHGLSARVKLNQQDSFLLVTFPAEMRESIVKAEITLYRPSDMGKDKQGTVFSHNGVVKWPLANDVKGYYEIHVRWLCNGLYYYQEDKHLFK
jgi:hypothetical protein